MNQEGLQGIKRQAKCNLRSQYSWPFRGPGGGYIGSCKSIKATFYGEDKAEKGKYWKQKKYLSCSDGHFMADPSSFISCMQSGVHAPLAGVLAGRLLFFFRCFNHEIKFTKKHF